MSAAGGRIPIVIGIDVEPDERLIDHHHLNPWLGFERTYACLSRLRRRVAERRGRDLRFCWFIRMDPQIADAYGHPAWVLKRYPDFISEALAAGDEMGVHPHLYRWDAEHATWVVDRVNQEWVDHCVRSSFEAFYAAFKRSCRVYRMGDRSLSNATLAVTEALGARVDVTVEPGYIESPGIFRNEAQTGSLPDYTRAPRHPYRPSRTDFCRPDPDGRDIWLLPVSTWRVPQSLRLLRRMYLGMRTLQGMVIPDDLRLQSTITFSLALPTYLFRPIVDQLLNGVERPYLLSIDRSDVGMYPHKLARIDTNVDYLLSHPLAHRFVFVRPEEALGILGCRPAPPALCAPEPHK